MPNFLDRITQQHKSGAKGTVTLVQQAAIAFNDNGKALLTIPNGAKIRSVTVLVTTGFNGTTPTYHVGYAADNDAIVAGGTLPSTAGSAAFNAPASTAVQWNGVTSGAVIGTFAGGGSNTAGAGFLRIEYFL